MYGLLSLYTGLTSRFLRVLRNHEDPPWSQIAVFVPPPPWGEGVTLIDIPGGWVGGWVGDEVILSLKSDRSNILLNNFKYHKVKPS